MRPRLLLIPLLLLSTQACLSMPTPREGTRPLRTGEETAKTAQEDTLKDLDAKDQTSLVLYSTSADARVTPTPSKAKATPKDDAQTNPAPPQDDPKEDQASPVATPESPSTESTTTP